MTEDPARTEERLVAGRYRLVEPLGSGGMGTVWRADDLVLARQVAVKEVTFPLGLSQAEREVLRERTRREARAAARLDHPSAVTVFDVVEEDGRPFLVMELVAARTLAEVVRTDGPLGPVRAAQVGLAVLGALRAAHARGIVHRDVKPGNVLLVPPEHGDGRVVLTDFGIATSTGDSSLTSTGLLLGSPSYIAPERARGEAPAPASDLWSLGATLFTAVEGRPPYDRGEPMSTLTAVVTDDREAYAAAGPLVPALDGLLEPDPAKRLSHEAAGQLLRRVVAGGEVAAAAAADPARPADDGARRRAEVTSALPVGAPPASAAAGPAAALVPAAAGAGSPRDTGAEAGAVAVRPPLSRPPRTVSADGSRGSGPGDPHRGRRLLVLALAGLLVLALVGTAVAVLLSRGSGSSGADSTTAPQRQASVGPTTTASAGQSATGTPSPSASARASTSATSSAAATASASATASGSATATATASASATASGSPSAVPAAGVPAGWGTYRDPSGYSLGRPPGWTVGRAAGLRELNDPASSRVLRIDPSALGTDSQVLASVRDTANQFDGRHTGYREIALVRAAFQGHTAVRWEFTYSDGGRRLHDLIYSFNDNGHSYALQYQSREADYSSGERERGQLLDSFRAAGT